MTAGPVSLDRLRRIGVIGAGQMGACIAHVCALAGFEVALTDVGEEALQRGRETIDRNLSRQIARGNDRSKKTPKAPSWQAVPFKDAESQYRSLVRSQFRSCSRRHLWGLDRVQEARRVRPRHSARSGVRGVTLGAAAGVDDVGVLWLDAHADFNTPETTKSGFLDGMALAALQRAQLVEPQDLLDLGLS